MLVARVARIAMAAAASRNYKSAQLRGRHRCPFLHYRSIEKEKAVRLSSESQQSLLSQKTSDQVRAEARAGPRSNMQKCYEYRRGAELVEVTVGGFEKLPLCERYL